MPDTPNVSDVTDSLEPEVASGPFGVPYVKPKGAPDLPGSDIGKNKGRRR
jgi:hypothetical protein